MPVWTGCWIYKGLDTLVTVLPAKSDSDIMFCLQLLSKYYLVHSTWANTNR